MTTAITREQFVRGFNAIVAHYAGRASIEKAMEAAGWEDCRFGYDPVVMELEHQLAERCGDDVKALGGSMISYALNERHECSDPASGLTLKVDSAEAVWTWWEATNTGPFARPPINVHRLADDLDEVIAAWVLNGRSAGELIMAGVALRMSTDEPDETAL